VEFVQKKGEIMQSSKFPPSVSTLPNVHELTVKHRMQFLIGHV